MPSESSGWGIHLLVSLPRSIAQANLVSQLEVAGFRRESETVQRGLVRFIRDDAYVWGMVSDGPPGLTSVLLSLTQGSEAASQANGE